MRSGRIKGFAQRFLRDRSGANAIEFAILGVPFIMLLLFTLQMGLLAMAKMALDLGVLKTAEDLQVRFSTTSAPILPTAATVKSNVASFAGGMISNGAGLAVEVQPLQNLSSVQKPVSDGTANFGVARNVLAVRASYAFATMVPGLSNVITVSSSTLVRRQSQ